MNLQQAAILLEKINVLFKSISMDEGNITSIEKDLMLSYLRQLYDSFLMEGDDLSSNSSVQKADKPSAYTASGEEIKPSKKEKKRKPPRILEIPDSLKDLVEPAPKPAEKKKIKPLSPKPKRQDPPPQPTQKPPETKPKAVQNEDAESYSQLFSFQSAKELSEKLSTLPISDLTKAVGLNDKILIVNELFDGDQPSFQQTLVALNQLNSFEEAKEYLSNSVAMKYNWTAKAKKTKAKNFIKIIRRRYQ